MTKEVLMLPIVTYTHCTLGKAHKEEAVADGVEVEEDVAEGS